MSNHSSDPSPEEEHPSSQDLSASGLTIPSESDPFTSLSPPSASPPQSSSYDNNGGDREQKVIIYSKPTFWTLLRGAAINLLLPFVNGMMLGLGELLAHEVAFRIGWGTTQIFPKHRSSRPIGPGIEMRDDPVERRKREGAGDRELLDSSSLE